MDANDNGKISVDDAIYLLSYLFKFGSTLPQPFKEPGIDLTKSDLKCGSKENKKLNDAIIEIERDNNLNKQLKETILNILINMLLKGDINRDCEVGIRDLVILGQNYNKQGNEIKDKRADLNKDGKIDILDLVILTQNYGKVC